MSHIIQIYNYINKRNFKKRIYIVTEDSLTRYLDKFTKKGGLPVLLL